MTNVFAADISLQYKGLKLNANLEKTDDWQAGPVILMTHGTLAHNKMEIMSTLQKLLKEQGVSSLAINLGLNINDRPSAFYDCPTPHSHKHTDTLDEIGAWLNWLQQQNVKQVVLLGHSRGGNQTAWFAADRDNDLITKIILIAPQTWSMEYAKQSYQASYNKDLTPLLKQAQDHIAAGRKQQLLEHIDFIYCRDTSATAESVISYYNDDPKMDTLYLLDKIRKPMLIFAGTEDTVVKNLDTLLPPLAELHGFRLEVLDGADHSFRDLYADEMVEHIIDFVNN